MMLLKVHFLIQILLIVSQLEYNFPECILVLLCLFTVANRSFDASLRIRHVCRLSLSNPLLPFGA